MKCMTKQKTNDVVVPGVVVGCANPVLVEMLGLDCLSSAFSGLSALRGLAALLGNHFILVNCHAYERFANINTIMRNNVSYR